MDAVQRLTWDAEQVAAVLGNTSTGEFVLADLSRRGAPLSEAESAVARLKGFGFLGVVGRYTDGTIDTKSETAVDAQSIMCSAVPAFIVYLDRKFAPNDDGSGWVQWLERLYALPDTRD
jgi:hypothetical protein